MRVLRRWWWIPLVALAAILIKSLLLGGMVTGMAKDGSLAALEGAGLNPAVDFVSVDGANGFGGDGMNVTLRGPASAEEAAVSAVSAREEVDEVVYEVTEDDTVVEPEPVEEEPAPAVELDPIKVALVATGAAISLEGVVPDEATRETLISSAVTEYGAENVTHDLTIDPDGYTTEDGLLVITGQTTSADEQAGWVSSGTAVATAAGLAIDDQTELIGVSIEESLNDLFQLDPIEFDRNEATIRPSSVATLDTAAEMINANPDAGRLLVVGHTDSDGSDASNQSLSQARAEAVVDYLVDTGGVDADRLEHEGRGESELLVSPEESAEDKQRNRRIAWELLS